MDHSARDDALFAAGESLYLQPKYKTCAENHQCIQTKSRSKSCLGGGNGSKQNALGLFRMRRQGDPPHHRPQEAGAQAGCEAVVVGAEAARPLDNHRIQVQVSACRRSFSRRADRPRHGQHRCSKNGQCMCQRRGPSHSMKSLHRERSVSSYHLDGIGLQGAPTS